MRRDVIYFTVISKNRQISEVRNEDLGFSSLSLRTPHPEGHVSKYFAFISTFNEAFNTATLFFRAENLFGTLYIYYGVPKKHLLTWLCANKTLPVIFP